MTSFIFRRSTYVPFVSGAAISAFVIALNNYLHNTASSIIIISTHLLVVIVLGIIAGFSLKDKLANPYVASASALLYTYALSILLTAITNPIHYSLSVLVTATLSVGLFYLSDKFFHLRLNNIYKILIVITGFSVLFITCSYIGLYIIQNLISPY